MITRPPEGAQSAPSEPAIKDPTAEVCDKMQDMQVDDEVVVQWLEDPELDGLDRL